MDMKKWPVIKIAELVEKKEADLQTGPFGTQLKASDYVEAGVPVINVKNIGYGSVQKEKLEFLNEKMARKLSVHSLKKGDIVFGRKGAVDRHALICQDTEGWIQGSDCLRLRIRSRTICNNYISCYFNTSAHKYWMEAVCSFGATMSSLNQDIVKRIHIPFPPLSEQEKIASVLSAYDDLIENNKRRIAMLEKMAEEIYREWFVRMRFPGHEKVKCKKGSPEEWQNLPSIEVFDVLSGGTPKTNISAYWDGDIPFFTPKDAKDNFYVLNTEKSITANGLSNCNSRLYSKNTIFITARGTVGKLVLTNCDMAMNQSCYALLPKAKNEEIYFYFLSLKNAISYIKGISKSGVFDNIIVDTFKVVPIVLPPNPLRNEFNKRVSPFFKQISSLSEKNEILGFLRDILLGRLISGKLSVESLDIQFPPSMIDEQDVDHAELHLRR